MVWMESTTSRSGATSSTDARTCGSTVSESSHSRGRSAPSRAPRRARAALLAPEDRLQLHERAPYEGGATATRIARSLLAHAAAAPYQRARGQRDEGQQGGAAHRNRRQAAAVPRLGAGSQRHPL